MMNVKNTIWIVAGLLLLGSCNQQKTSDWDGKLILAWQMTVPASKSITDNTWDGDERVFVSIDNEPAQLFTVAVGGMLTPEQIIWWQSSTQTISARAWYPDPAAWSFPADQSGGFQAADFVFAPTVSGIKYNNYLGNPLQFYHLPAKVIVNLMPGVDIDSVNDAVVTFYGYRSGEVDTDSGLIAGSDTDQGWITPFRASGSNTYTALLIPRDMTAVKFVKVELGGYDYYYTPAAGEAVLELGNAYVYNIQVDRTRLVVTVVGNGPTWGNSDDDDTVSAVPVE